MAKGPRQDSLHNNSGGISFQSPPQVEFALQCRNCGGRVVFVYIRVYNIAQELSDRGVLQEQL